ncbi:hypothetical protein LAG90_04975 [Marinilongibacter aquaticus]|uniref:3-coathanger stack domain-containing protein n=1 Tax=Marinilongibacter aquaticus TaxID=2975157 RepID=UPI0021BD1870|nr:3-coathanger stack domain-containing protein [Marinilongibacter aquaticus]UBM60001.1 hypothetical protein LAG90_04975 [Marinilongibacter aquaticus]
MRKLSLLFGLVFSGLLLQAQSISHVEYFIDNDPGIGNATGLSITPGSEVTVSFSFPVTSLTDGFHYLSVRAQDADGDWGNTTYRVFAKFNTDLGTVPAPQNITALEYFIDNDPGHGAGTSIPIIPDLTLNKIPFSFSVNSLSDGFHILSVRAQDAGGDWGNTNYRVFVKFDTDPPVNTPPSPIAYLEYFVDDDPGVGNGTSVPVSNSLSVEDLTFQVDLNGLSNGVHWLSVRSRNTNGDWNQVNYQPFTIRDNIVAIGNVAEAFCRENAFSVPFTVSGTFSTSNVFTLQLSDENGSFSNPTTLGTYTGNTSGTIQATIPAGVTIATGYKLRIIASDPAETDQPFKLFEVLDVCPAPCANSVALSSTADDISGTITLIEVSSANGHIEGSNKVTDGAEATFRAGKYIKLEAGFEVEAGSVFLTEFGGCD